MKLLYSGFIALLLGFNLLFTVSISPTKAEEFNEGAQKFVASLADKAERSLLEKGITPEERTARFRSLMLESFDLDGVGKWVLGRYWRKTTPAEQANYRKLFEEFIIATYSSRFKAYTEAKLQINGTTSRQDSAFVDTQINREGATPIRIIWRITFADGKYQIVDIVVEGVSWVQTQRSEFVSVIRNNGGKISGLLDALNRKIADLKTSTG